MADSKLKPQEFYEVQVKIFYLKQNDWHQKGIKRKQEEIPLCRCTIHNLHNLTT